MTGFWMGMSGLRFSPLWEEGSLSVQDSIKKLNVHVFGRLRDNMDEKGLPYQMEMDIPPEGCLAHAIAEALQLPMVKVESVFRNGRVINIYDPVFPGDRVAFFPHGTPGPYRVFLGIARENAERARRESSAEQTAGSRHHHQAKNGSSREG